MNFWRSFECSHSNSYLIQFKRAISNLFRAISTAYTWIEFRNSRNQGRTNTTEEWEDKKKRPRTFRAGSIWTLFIWPISGLQNNSKLNRYIWANWYVLYIKSYFNIDLFMHPHFQVYADGFFFRVSLFSVSVSVLNSWNNQCDFQFTHFLSLSVALHVIPPSSGWDTNLAEKLLIDSFVHHSSLSTLVQLLLMDTRIIEESTYLIQIFTLAAKLKLLDSYWRIF